MPRLLHGPADLASADHRASLHRDEADALREQADAHDAAADFMRDRGEPASRVAHREAASVLCSRRAAVRDAVADRLDAYADRVAYIGRQIDLGARAVEAADIDGNAANGEPETGLVDTLASLLHWADAHGVDLRAALTTAEIHHTAETNGPI